MARHNLFSQSARMVVGRYGHNTDMNTFSVKETDADAISPWNDTRAPQYATLDVYVANAVNAYFMGKNAKMTVCLVSDQAGDETFSTEYKMSDGTTLLASLSVKGNLKAAVIDSTGTYKLPPAQGSPKTEFDLSSIMALILMSAATQYPDIKDLLEKGKAEYESDGILPQKKVLLLCDYIEMGVKQGKILANLVGGNFELLSKKDVDSGVLKGAVLFGKKPKLLFGDKSDASLDGRRPQSFSKLYALPELVEWRKNHSHWTEEEKALIPVIPKNFPVSVNCQKMVNRYIKTRQFKRPMVDMMYIGTSSLGKSTDCEVLAGLLGTPLLRETCYSTMETQDFLTRFIPDNGSEELDLPTDDDCAFDPEMSFFRMTGTWKDDADTDQCLQIRETMKKKKPDSTPHFKMIESNFIRALEHGYICEVQEISHIKDQGVPVGLNEYDRAGAIIPKADGTTARRHPEALVIYTDNIGFGTCHELDPSVKRRMSFCLIVRKLSKADALARIKYNTGFTDKEKLEKMYKIWSAIQEHCEKNGIDSGICTVNELEQWVSLCQIEGFEDDVFLQDLKEAVINKATTEEDEQEELLNVVKVYL